MSDVWQRVHNIADGDTNSDLDGDGHNNLAESKEGTNPRDGKDYFRILNFSVTPVRDSVTLTWRSLASRYYRIEKSEDLITWTSTWSDYAYGNRDEIQTTQAFPITPSFRSKGFFRVLSYGESDGDWDGDRLFAWEEKLLGTNPDSRDSENDGMDDGFEFIYMFNPLSAIDAAQDADGDLFSNVFEARIRSNPRFVEPDTDNDGLLDPVEAFLKTNPNLADSDSDGISDALEDSDFDGLGNLVEIQIHVTDPKNFDTDGDLMSDGWEVQQGLNPNDSSNNNGANGDLDTDGLNNFNEYLNGTSVSSSDSDGDGTSDEAEVRQGSDPTDPSDGGQAPEEMKEVPFSANGDYALWEMTITGKGPLDMRVQKIITTEYEQTKTKSLKLRKGNKYEVRMRHLKTLPNARPETWWCWEAQIDAKPQQATYNSYESTRIPNVATAFMVGDHWLVDNQDGLLTSHVHMAEGSGSNIAGSAVATLLPIKVTEELESGETAGCTGYDKDENALMVPMSGSNKIRVEIATESSDLLEKIKFVADVQNKLSIQPETPASGDQVLTFSGSAKALGVKIQLEVDGLKSDLFEADVLQRLERTIEIHGITEENDDVQSIAPGASGAANAVCVSAGSNGFRDTIPSGDDAISGNNITVGLDRICNTTANDQNLVPLNIPSAASLAAYLNNKTWGNQANVHFTVTRSDHTVNYDLDRNEMLADEFEFSVTRAEDDAITAAARNTGKDFNAYYVNKHEYPIGVTLREQIFTQGSLPGMNSVDNHTAHEVGHLIGRRGHVGAGEDNLMYAAGLSSNPCRILRNEWRMVNP